MAIRGQILAAVLILPTLFYYTSNVLGLLGHRLLFVMGKGGVGKTTIAAAIGLVGARHGLRTLVVEVSSQDRIQRAFDAKSGRLEEIELASGLFGVSLDPQHAMEEYLRSKAGPLGRVLGSSKMFQALSTAAPGMPEMLSMAKIWELARPERLDYGAIPYDLVVVDAPSTGHGVALLRTPQTFAGVAQVGPVAQGGRMIAAMIADRAFTGVIAVATAEEMVVNETLMLRDALIRDGLELEAVILNGVYPDRFDEREMGKLHAMEAVATSAAARAAIRTVVSEHARAAYQRIQRERLSEGINMPLIELPYLFVNDLGRGELELLAGVLDKTLVSDELSS